MIKKIKKNNKKIILLLILVLIFKIIIFIWGYNINSVPEGEYISSLNSPNNKYILNSYRYSGGATMDWTLRVELVNKITKKKRNIYWKYHEYIAEMQWMDDDNVMINGLKLNIHKDKYDFRRD